MNLSMNNKIKFFINIFLENMVHFIFLLKTSKNAHALQREKKSYQVDYYIIWLNLVITKLNSKPIPSRTSLNVVRIEPSNKELADRIFW